LLFLSSTIFATEKQEFTATHCWNPLHVTNSNRQLRSIGLDAKGRCFQCLGNFGTGRQLSEALPLIGIIMGSRSDWETMREASATLAALHIPHECRVVSAHRTPDRLYEYAKSAAGRGLQCIIAGAGGAAHLPGMAASMTRLPVLGVPVQSKALDGMDSLLSIVQMPAGIPVGTLAIGKAGATNAALLAAAMLANSDAALAERLDAWRAAQTASVAEAPE
jgi:5-(carboxyamino)imidazole ribonucleotide mutase